MSDIRIFRDDDRDGFELRVIQAHDGDFYLAIWPNNDDMEIDERMAGSRLYSNSIRVRMPMIGGGEHEALWHALASVFKKTRPPTSVEATTSQLSEKVDRLVRLKQQLTDVQAPERAAIRAHTAEPD
jgi:hypothetical protein